MAIECKRSMVIAKLMGLDSHPDKQPPSGVRRSIAQDSQTKPFVQDLVQCFESRRDRSLSDIMSPPHHLSLCVGVGDEHTARKDVCQVQQEVSSNGSKDNSADYKKKMDHVLENFMEAKRLSLNNRDLLQSKEFSDALEVLSSNCDLFLKFLRDPNSQISRHLQGLQRSNLSSQSDHSTLPKPSHSASTTESADNISVDHLVFEDKFPMKTNGSAQPTRIVVLKPGLGRNAHVRNEVVRSISLPSALEGSQPFGALTASESRGAREVAKRITSQIQKTLSSSNSSNNNNNNKRSETLSCLLSKECAEESSLFDGSEKEYNEEECASSASQNMDPTSQVSWDYVNRRGSHYLASSSSLTQAATPHLSESSIFREARRRLSERWLLVTSSKGNQESKRFSRSSSTLAEMLSVSDKREATEKSLDACTYMSEGDGILEEFPRNLQKSNSVPQSSSTYKHHDVNDHEFNDEDVLCFHVTTGSVHAAATAVNKPTKGSMSFLKGKVSSLFLSRKRKGSSEQSPELSQENNHSGEVTCLGYHCSTDCSSRESPICSRNILGGGDPLNTEQDDGEPGTCLTKERLPLEKLLAIESNEEQEQPSPVSVLQAPFEVDSVSSGWSQSLDDGSHEFQQECQHAASLPDTAVAVAQCLTFDENGSSSTSDTEEEKSVDLVPGLGDVDGGYPEWLEFVKMVLSWSGLGGGGETSVIMLWRWQSVESPLDPALLGKLLERKEEDEEENTLECRERRSVQRLLFDCVNAALTELSMTSLLEAAFPLLGYCPKTALPGGGGEVRRSARSLAAQVVFHVKETLCPEETWSGLQDQAALMASVTRKQAADSRWAREMKLEMVELGAEIQSLVLDELVLEVVTEVLLDCLLSKAS